MAALFGPVLVVPGSATQSAATPAQFVGTSGTLRISLTQVVTGGDVTATVSGSPDGTTWTIITTHFANDLSTLNLDGVGDISIAEIPFTNLPANLKIEVVSTASFTLTVELL